MTEHTTHAPTNEIPYGYCHCGCGQKTKIAPRTDRTVGWIKGEPLRYIRYHTLPKRPDNFVPWQERAKLQYPFGYCQCGCGQKTKLATGTSSRVGNVKGQPVRYIYGHQTRSDVVPRFWENVDRRDTDDCWPWIGRTDKDGYGIISRDGINIKAHRLSYELHRGCIGKGMLICHKCDNPRCCNPNHLFEGTDNDNMKDMVAKGRSMTGSRQHKAKLTESDIPQIRHLSAQGLSANAIAKQYNVKPATISNVIRGRAWKHVP